MPAFSKSYDRIESQARAWATVTPSDSASLTTVPKGLYIGGAGNIALRGEDGTDVTFAVLAGAFLPLCPVRVLATGTTATGIVALY